MNRIHVLPVALSLLALLAVGRVAGAESPEDDVRAVLASMENAWNAGDMNGYLAAYAREGGMSLAFGNQSVSGFEALETLFSGAYPSPTEMGRFTIDTFTVDFLRPDVAVAYGRFTHYFPHETVHGGYSHVFALEGDGSWKIRHERTSRGETQSHE